MSQTSPGKVAETTQHLIVEAIGTESLANSVMPSFKRQGVTVLGARHVQVMRYVYTLVEAEDVYFQGRRLEQMPGLREFMVEWLRPGQQIVSRPTGRYSVLHAYTGKKNILVGQLLQRQSASVQLNFIGLFGRDPAPERVLYGNPAVPFVQHGDLPPLAAAYYDGASRRLTVLRDVQRETLLQDFLRRFSRELARAG